jgi:hypothetical protein
MNKGMESRLQPVRCGAFYHLLLMRLTNAIGEFDSAARMLLDTDASQETFQTVLETDAFLKDLRDRLDPSEPQTTPKQRHEAKN